MASRTEINSMLSSIVERENAQYHSRVREVLAELPDMNKVRNDLKAEMSRRLGNFSEFLSVDVRHDLSALFNAEVLNFTFVAALPSVESRCFSATVEPYKVWEIAITEGAISAGKASEEDARAAFEVYFFTTDPDVKRIRDALKAAFPSAHLFPRLELGPTNSCLVIGLVFDPPPVECAVKLECAEYPTWVRGEQPRW
jgi:hypothetical protein